MSRMSLSYSVVIFLVLYHLTTVWSLPTETNASRKCDPECNSTSVCIDGECVFNFNCQINCSAEDVKVCGSDSVTYDNRCELNEYNCLNGENITVKHEGKCNSCKKQRERNNKIAMESRNYEDLLTNMVKNICRNNNYLFLETYNYGSPFWPECSETDPDDYAPVQGNIFCWKSWCSTKDGHVIENSITSYNPKLRCDLRKSCKYNGEDYTDGTEIEVQENSCICLDGEFVCPRNYTSPSGSWLSEELTQLKHDNDKMFYFQYKFAEIENNFDDHIQLPLYRLDMDQYKADISEQDRKEFGDWKFSYYDSSNNGMIEPIEAKKFMKEIINLVKVKTFEDQLREIIDTDKDKKFSKKEWDEFINLTEIDLEKEDITPVSNSIARRSIKRLLRTRSKSQ